MKGKKLLIIVIVLNLIALIMGILALIQTY